MIVYSYTCLPKQLHDTAYRFTRTAGFALFTIQKKNSIFGSLAPGFIADCRLECFTQDLVQKICNVDKNSSVEHAMKALEITPCQITPCQFTLKYDDQGRRSIVAPMARVAMIILLTSLLTNSLAPSDCKQYATPHRDVHSNLLRQRELTRLQLQQAPTQAPNTILENSNIRLVCSATRYPASCVDALLPDERSQTASTPQAVVEVLTAIAMERLMHVGLADAQTLATLVTMDVTSGDRTNRQCNVTTMLATTTYNNKSLAAASAGCTELLDLAEHYVQSSHASLAIKEEVYEHIQAWLSGALTQSNDCYYSLASWRETLEFVKEMTDRGSVTVKLISNALALVDAFLYYGPDATLWRPPPETREQQLKGIDTHYKVTESFPNWMDEASQAFLVNADVYDQFTPDVTVTLDSSIQAAVDQAPAWSPTRYVIHIQSGVHNETVHIPKEKTNLMFLGDGSNVTIITGNLHVHSPGTTTWLSATVAVNGAGFIARGITFENTAGPEQHQAVALRVASDRSAFHECSILGHQDSLYTHSLRQFYKNCTIAGTVDFIFGNSAAVFQTCHILVRPREDRVTGKATTSILTAQGRIDPGQETALVFQNCTVDGTPEYNALQRAHHPRGLLHRVYLGRPWKTYSRTVFLFTHFALTLQPQGWLAWNGSFALDTLLDAEHGSFGPGAGLNMSQRTPWSSQLSLRQAQRFSAQRLLRANTWLPQTTIPYSPFV